MRSLLHYSNVGMKRWGVIGENFFLRNRLTQLPNQELTRIPTPTHTPTRHYPKQLILNHILPDTAKIIQTNNLFRYIRRSYPTRVERNWRTDICLLNDIK
eukprot:GHVR01014478.1.p1 GENE.GHVR01014478.1~~GHVR01014478.1.p1  ORF type:complete len:100 (+),score=10.88 GHVR01014478.1:101-400(+)